MPFKELLGALSRVGMTVAKERLLRGLDVGIYILELIRRARSKNLPGSGICSEERELGKVSLTSTICHAACATWAGCDATWY